VQIVKYLRIKTLTLSSVLLASCATPIITSNANPIAQSKKAQIGEFGFDAAGMDKSFKPGDDFYQYANGTWLKQTPIPPEKSNYGMFTRLADLSEQHSQQIIEQAAAVKPNSPNIKTDQTKVGDLYRAFMDEQRIESQGFKPLAPHWEQIESISTRTQLIAQFGKMTRLGVGSPIGVAIYTDLKEPQLHIGYLGQSGLGLPDKDMYDEKRANFSAVRQAYLAYIEAMFTLAQMPNAKQRAASVYQLEDELSEVHWSRTESRDAVKTYNRFDRQTLIQLAPQFDWPRFLASVGLDQQPNLVIRQPSAVQKSTILMQQEPIEVWKDYCRLKWLTFAAPHLPKRFVDTHFDFYSATLRGIKTNTPRWKRGVELVNASMSEAVAQTYVQRHFVQSTKQKALDLVNNISQAMGQRLDSLQWMSAQTKSLAAQKLSSYVAKIGYPDQWKNYDALNISPTNAVANAVQVSEFNFERSQNKLGQTADRKEWFMAPMTVNAYYNATLNEIVFPAAILQAPFFDPNADDAINYGGIGAVIGHEITHGFDDQGSRFDAKGQLRDWWTKQDRDQFNSAAEKLVAQYDQYCPFAAQEGKPAQCVKGQLTLGENIADLAGLTIAHQAYRLSLKGKPAPILNGLTGDQRFFLGWAQVWRRNFRDAERANRLLTDTHSPEQYRVAVVRNLDIWYEAFNVKPGDKLYLEPSQRVRIW
jgi:putative endopeptidase